MLSVYRFCTCFTPKYWDSGQASIFLLHVFTRTEFGEWHLFTGIKAYFVWPITYPWNRHDKIWSPLPPVEGRPLRRLHTSACRAPAHHPGIYWLQEEASAFHSTPVPSSPTPDTFPFEVVMLGITGFTLPLPFPEVPSSLWVQHLSYNVKKHTLPSPPMWFPPPRLSPPDLSYCLSDLLCNSDQAVMEPFDPYSWWCSRDDRTMFVLLSLL